jgi:hypothetical protein
MRYLCVAVALMLAMILVPDLLLAQGPPPPALPGMPDAAPIDGGLSLLAAAGGAYAWRKLRNPKQH